MARPTVSSSSSSSRTTPSACGGASGRPSWRRTTPRPSTRSRTSGSTSCCSTMTCATGPGTGQDIADFMTRRLPQRCRPKVVNPQHEHGWGHSRCSSRSRAPGSRSSRRHSRCATPRHQGAPSGWARTARPSSRRGVPRACPVLGYRSDMSRVFTGRSSPAGQVEEGPAR